MTLLRIACAAGCASLAVSAMPRTAAADEPAFTIGSRPAWVVLGGLTTGGTIALADRGALVGGELSLARLRDAQFAGVYADAYYDWGAHGTYVTSGLEFGHSFLGLDGGVAFRFADQTNVGAAARVTIGLGVAGVYVRYAHFGGALDGEKDVLQLGLVLKLPVWTGGDR